MVLVLCVYTHVEVFFYTIHPLLKVLLTILPKCPSLSPDNAMEGERKRNSVKMQPRNKRIKVNLKALCGPFTHPRGSIPCFPLSLGMATIEMPGM